MQTPPSDDHRRGRSSWRRGNLGAWTTCVKLHILCVVVSGLAWREELVSIPI